MSWLSDLLNCDTACADKGCPLKINVYTCEERNNTHILADVVTAALSQINALPGYVGVNNKYAILLSTCCCFTHNPSDPVTWASDYQACIESDLWVIPWANTPADDNIIQSYVDDYYIIRDVVTLRGTSDLEIGSLVYPVI